MPSTALTTPQIASRSNRPRSLYEWLVRLSDNTSAALAALFIVNILCHWQTLAGYYLADDFVHVAYLKEVFSGHPELLLKNFYSTWLQTEGTNFYRPFISITLAFDRLVFGFSPIGYHLTNLVYQCVSTVGLYLVVKECMPLFRGKTDNRNHDGGSILPLISAMLFAVHPLHAEVVGWIIARVDSVCCAYYLLSMWLFLRARRVSNTLKVKRMLLSLSLGAFILSLISKEMAVTLPPALVLLMVLFPENRERENENRFRSILTSIKNALKNTWQLWLILVVYAVVRTLALGSVTGGYQGSIGEGLTSSTMERIFSIASMQRVAFPLNAEVFSPLRRLVRPLAVTYAIALLLFAARVIATKNRVPVFKVVSFAALWFLLVMLPTIPVWNLTESLQGSRFIYMGTAPLCLLIASLLAPMWGFEPDAGGTGAGGTNSRHTRTDIRALGGLSSAVAIVIISFYGYICFGNDSAWVHAGSELRTLRDELDSQVGKLPKNASLALLNLPHKYKGAHMLYNAATLSVLLAPPLNEQDIVSRVATFEPVLFGDDDLIRISRVRKMLESGSRVQFFYWNRDNEKLVPVYLHTANVDINLDENCPSPVAIDIDARGNPVKKLDESSGVLSSTPGHEVLNDVQLISPALDIQPASVDFLDICVSARLPGGATASDTIPIVIQWTGDNSASFNEPENLVTTVKPDGKTYKMRIHVSEHKKWLSRGKIHRIAVLSPHPQAVIEVHGLSLRSGRNEIPVLTAASKNMIEDESGVARAGGKLGLFDYDVSAVTGAQSALFEVSKPDAWFEHYTNTYRDSAACKNALKSFSLKSLKGQNQSFNLKELGGPGFYELRTAALGSNGEVVGYFSDPIMFQLGH